MLGIDDTFSFTKDEVPLLGMTNFSPPEDGFIWSTGPWCQITLPFDSQKGDRGGLPDGPLDVALDIDVFKSLPDLDGQNVFFYINGLRLASRFLASRVIVMLDLPAGFVRLADNVIVIDTPDAARPDQHGGTDPRRLGIQLFSLRVTSG